MYVYMSGMVQAVPKKKKEIKKYKKNEFFQTNAKNNKIMRLNVYFFSNTHKNLKKTHPQHKFVQIQ